MSNFITKSKEDYILDDTQIKHLTEWRDICDYHMINTPASAQLKKSIWLDESKKTTRVINQYKYK